jgi:sulfite reductase (NADPH) flavoprotein alpha-component
MSFVLVRRFLISAHRWIALVLAPVFIVIILSGAVLSFRPIMSDLAVRAAQSGTVDAQALATLIGKLEAIGPVQMVRLADGGRMAEVASSAADVAGRWDLAAGTRMASPSGGIDLFETAERLHKSLLLGLGLLVDAATWAMVAIMAIGPVLGWLRFRHTLMGWHKAVGWCLLPVTLLSPLTAALMTIGVGESRAPLPRAARPVGMAQALAVAAPDVDLSHLVMARRFRGGTVLMQAAGERGGVFAVTDKEATALTGGPGLVKQIHEGTWAGAWSGALNVIVSAALLGLTVTGCWSWLRRYQRRRGGRSGTGADVLVTSAGRSITAARQAPSA